MAERATPSPNDAEGTPEAVGALLLVERRRSRPPGEEWTARAPDGRLLDVWRVAGLDQGRVPREMAALSRLVEARHPNLVPVLAVGEREGGIWVVSELDAGRPLHRLLAIATLTPEQAALVTVGILEGLRALHDAGLWHGRLDERAVHVGAAGQVRLGEWGLDLDGADRGERWGNDRAAALRLLARLRRSVRQPGGRQAAASSSLLTALHACGAQDGDQVALLARAHESAEVLARSAAGERAADELPALISMLERDPRPSPARGAEALPAAPHPLRSPEAVWAQPSHRGRWLAAGLTVLLLVVVGGVAGLNAWHPRTVAVVPRPGPAASPRPATPPPTRAVPRPVPDLAPPTASPITAIEIQPLQGGCQTGAACPVQVTVRLQPQPSAKEVRWSFHVFDRCTGATSVLPGVSVTALAGWAYVYGTSWPTLSASHPTALVAVTETPAAAASPAVLAGGSGPC
jgi:hypothetical protein